MKRHQADKVMPSRVGRKEQLFVDRPCLVEDASKTVEEDCGAGQLGVQVDHQALKIRRSSRRLCRDDKRQDFFALSDKPRVHRQACKAEGAIETFCDISELFENAETAKNYEHALLMLDALPICCGLFNKSLKMVNCNRAAVHFFQCTGKMEICERILEMFPERQPDGRLSAEVVLLELKKAFETAYNRVEWDFLLPDGALVPAEVTIVKLLCGNEEMLAIYIRDLREERALRTAHNDANERMRLMFDATPICCNLWDENFNNIDCNQEAVRLFELSSKNDYLTRFFELSPKKQPDGELSAQKALEHITTAFTHGGCRFEWMHQKLNGEPIPVEITLIRVKRGDRFIVAGYTRDLRQEKSLLEAKKAAIQESQTDPLTRLYNKRAVKVLIDNVLNSPDEGRRHALVCIDLDNFKRINDDFGHLFGDEVLIDVSRKIKRLFRSSDILGRFGGDEFVLLIKDFPNIDLVKTKISTLCTQIQKTYRVGDVEHAISASIGISIYPEDGTEYNELYKKADEASYHTKKSGKNTFIFWEKCMHKKDICST